MKLTLGLIIIFGTVAATAQAAKTVVAPEILEMREYSTKRAAKIVQILKDAKVEMVFPEDEGSPVAGHGKKSTSAPEKLYILKLVYCVKNKKQVTCERPTLKGKSAKDLFDLLALEKVKVRKLNKSKTSVFVKELICFPQSGKMPAACRGETHYKK